MTMSVSIMIQVGGFVKTQVSNNEWYDYYTNADLGLYIELTDRNWNIDRKCKLNHNSVTNMLYKANVGLQHEHSLCCYEQENRLNSATSPSKQSCNLFTGPRILFTYFCLWNFKPIKVITWSFRQISVIVSAIRELWERRLEI